MCVCGWMCVCFGVLTNASCLYDSGLTWKFWPSSDLVKITRCWVCLTCLVCLPFSVQLSRISIFFLLSNSSTDQRPRAWAVNSGTGARRICGLFTWSVSWDPAPDLLVRDESGQMSNPSVAPPWALEFQASVVSEWPGLGILTALLLVTFLWAGERVALSPWTLTTYGVTC